MSRSLSENFIEFLSGWREHCRRSSAVGYAVARFRWYRPTKEDLDYTNPEQLAEPYETEDLDEQSQRYILDILDGGSAEADGHPSTNRGDAAVLATQNDLIVSATRAFNARHVAKLRHFGHADGVTARIGSDAGPLEQGIHRQLLTIMANAEHPRDKP